MSKFSGRYHGDTSSDHVIEPSDSRKEAMVITRRYCSCESQEDLIRIKDLVSKLNNKNEISLYLRWLLSREDRTGAVNICKVLLGLGRPIEHLVRDEILSELIVHVAVDLLQILLKADLDFTNFLPCQYFISTLKEDPTVCLWDSLVFRSLLCGKSGYRYESRPDPSERFAYVVIVAMIQASCFRTESISALAYVIDKYPINPGDSYTYGKVFRALVVAGLDPSEGFVSEMEGRESQSVPAYYEEYRQWYRDYRRCVPSLKHCARLVVRRTVQVNMELATLRMELPKRVADFLLLRDPLTLSVINIDDKD
ncbi:uncharacterized protein LOC124266828 [Haliotis rubra]|uniref:uncharacterized protein LOC124266828 n=1 Tax=Haliotis rubra TaxID=36100 RepID=UPI001EE58DE0|nr:uncharacterized protein LOC124266828 [Haliotis rubra]XP_046557586.1 uncharacterized protein LOC124266828 [Haliotis rubra]XP_046557587.1 uncharacterized protein LOC124266828 [Haliotis rubra]